MAISKKLLNPGEQVVFSGRTHPKALFLPILVLVLLLAVGVAVQVAVDNDTVVLGTWILVGLGILWFTVKPYIVWVSTVHAFTDRRLITRWGILTRNGHDIPLNRVSDISIEINLSDRPFGCGTLVVTNASDGGKVRLRDIPRAEENHRRLSALLHDPSSLGRRDDGA